MEGKVFSTIPPISTTPRDTPNNSDIKKQNQTRPPDVAAPESNSKPDNKAATTKPGDNSLPNSKPQATNSHKTPTGKNIRRSADGGATAPVKRNSQDVSETGSSVMFQLGRRMARLYLCDDHCCPACVDNLFYVFTKNNSNCSEAVTLRLMHLGMLELFQEIWRQLFRQAVADKNEYASPGSRKIDALLNSCGTVANMTDASPEVCDKVLQLDIDVDIIKYLKSDALNPTLTNSCLNSTLCELVEDLVTVLYNVVQVNVEARERFRDQDIVEVLQRFMTKTVDSLSYLATIFLAWVINEDENDVVDSHKETFELLDQDLESAVRSSKQRSHFGYKTTEVLAAINKLAVNDNNKDRIVRSGVLCSYAKLLETSNDVQVLFLAAQGLWTLASKCADDIKASSTSCIDCLKSLLIRSTNDGVRRQVMGALAALGVKSEDPKTEDDVSQGASKTATEKMQLFISYQHATKDTVLKLKDRLLRQGYGVWIDADYMCGSIGDDIIEGIDKSAVVLTCLSQKYYESPYCKKELIYADELHKELIPLTMEWKYKPHGWLSFRTSDKLRIDFSRPESFEESFQTLLQKLRKSSGSSTGGDSDKRSQDSQLSHLKPKDESNETGSTSERREVKTETISYSASTKIPASSWTTEHVKEWLERNNLQHLTKWFDSYDGRLLMEYQFTLERAPQLVAPSFITANSVADFMRVNMALREL